MKARITSSVLLGVLSLVPLSTPAVAQDIPTNQMYLPYGIPIPPGVEITLPPRPFNRLMHGKPLLNTSPDANMVGRRNVNLPKRYHSFSANEPYTPTFEPGSGDRGLWLTEGDGIYAGNDASLNLSIPDAASGTTIYAPTHMAPGNACIETVTAHWRYDGMASTAHGHGFWDWCLSDGEGGWQVFESMDSYWIDQYVRRFRGELRYWTQVYSDALSSWKGLLYNFNQGRWEEKTAISGSNVSGFGPVGWTMWESHYLMDGARLCPEFPDIKAFDLQLYVDGAWTKLTTSNSQNTLGPSGQCWIDGTYTFRLPKKRDMWLARTSK